MSNIANRPLSRRSVIVAGLGAVASLGLAACGASAPAPTSGSAATTGAADAAAAKIDSAAYDAIVNAGPVADASLVEANAWAKKVKEAGKLRVGGTSTSTLFSLLDETDNKVRGFDAGLSQLVSRYILGEVNVELLQVTSDTRESVLQNDQVDSVFATYSINDKRKQVISFAGPYYYTRQSILVLANNTDINGTDDLKGKNVAVQSGSTGPSIVKEVAPEANQQEFKTDEEARQALTQNRVDAYVIDTNMQLGSMAKNPGKFRLAGDPFGPTDNYGIGLPKDSDGVQFVNDFLKKIEDDGTWAKLWKVCIGDRAGIETVPEPPAIGA